MSSKVVKKNTSGMQVLKTLLLLMEDSYTMSEMVNLLNQKEEKAIFNHYVVSKYINTCRYCGIDILKINNKYFISKLPFGMDLTSIDIELIDNLYFIAKEKLTTASCKIFDKFINKIRKYSNQEIVKTENKNIQLTINVFEKAIKLRKKVLIIPQSKQGIECIPLGISESRGKRVFNLSTDGKRFSISVDKISGIQIVNKSFADYDNVERTIVYKLTGNLAQRYTLREHEIITDNNLPDSITVSNNGENIEELYARLRRYDTCCEVLYPSLCRQEMASKIKDALKNYGV